MTNVLPFRTASVALARTSLDDACLELDDAVRSLGEDDADTVMANPGLVALLLRVVGARRHLDAVEKGTPREGAPDLVAPELVAPSPRPPASLR